MAGQLQVRQGSLTRPTGAMHVSGENDLRWVRWGAWTDVQSPGWLWGFVLPNSGLVYEVRNAPETEPDA